MSKTVVDVLTDLANQWITLSNRADRCERRYRLAHARLNKLIEEERNQMTARQRQQDELGKRRESEERAALRAEETAADTNWEEAAEKRDAHPFPAVVDELARETGYGSDFLAEAARAGFNASVLFHSENAETVRGSQALPAVVQLLDQLSADRLPAQIRPLARPPITTDPVQQMLDRMYREPDGQSTRIIKYLAGAPNMRVKRSDLELEQGIFRTASQQSDGTIHKALRRARETLIRVTKGAWDLKHSRDLRARSAEIWLVGPQPESDQAGQN